MSATHSPNPNPYLRSNFHHLYADIFWYGVLAGSTLAFLAVYAAHVGANSFQIGLLTGSAAVVNLLGSLPTGRWLENRSLIRITFQTSIWNRVGYLILIPLTWLLPATTQAWALIVLIIVMSIPGTILAIAFSATFADAVPPEWRAHVVGRRNALLAISLALTSVVCGQLLDRISFPLNYQIVFSLGALGAAMSSYHLRHLHLPASAMPSKPVELPAQGTMPPKVTRFMETLHRTPGLRFLARANGRPWLRLDLLQSPFGLFLAAYFLFYTFQYIPIPLFPLVWVQHLHLSDGEISLGYTLNYAAMLVSSFGLRWLSARYGHHRVLWLGALLFCLYPLLNGLAKDATLFWIASLMGGAVWALASGGLVSRLMERVPADDRPAHMALHNLVLNLGILTGSLLGPALGDWLGLREVLLLSAGLRFLGGVLLGWWG